MDLVSDHVSDVVKNIISLKHFFCAILHPAYKCLKHYIINVQHVKVTTFAVS